MMNAIKIKQRLHQRLIVRYRINHFHGHFAQFRLAQGVNVHIGRIQNFVSVNFLTARKHCLGDFFGSGSAVCRVEFHAKITIRSTRIMASG